MPLISTDLRADALRARYGKRYPWLVLAVAALGIVASVLATTSFSVAIPAIMQQYGLGQEQAQWTMTGFMAAMAIGMLPAPWLLQRHGFRKVFLWASILLTLTGVLGALVAAHIGFYWLVAIRLLQGLVAGALQPLGTLVVMRLFPPHAQGRASGLMSVGIVLAPAVAPSLGGLLVDWFSWPAIFWLGLPFSLCGIVLGLRWLPVADKLTRSSFDWLGVLLLSGATLLLIEGIAGMQSHGLLAPPTLAFLSLTVLLAGLFMLHARRIEHPIIHLELFREARFGMGVIVFLAYGFGVYASSYLIPVFMLQALHYSATAAGAALMPSGIALALVIPVAGHLADRFSPLLVTAGGLALFCLSSILLALLAQDISYTQIVIATVIGRIGLGMILPALGIAALRSLAPETLSQASVISSYVRQLGGVLGIAMTDVFVSWREGIYPDTAAGVSHAYADGFWLIAGMYLVALVAAWFMRERQHTS